MIDFLFSIDLNKKPKICLDFYSTFVEYYYNFILIIQLDFTQKLLLVFISPAKLL